MRDLIGAVAISTAVAQTGS